MNSTRNRFVVGFALAALAVLVLNAVPFILTRGAYNGDGFEVIGFPFIFRRLGGITGIYEFRIPALLADVVLGVAVAIVAGYFCARVRRRESDL